MTRTRHTLELSMVQLDHPVSNRSAARPPMTTRIDPRSVVVGTLVAGVLALLITQMLTGAGYRPAPFGLPDPGFLTTYGISIAQYASEFAGIAVVGLLLLRVANGAALSDNHPGRRLAVLTARWAWVWVGSSALWIGFTVSELAGHPLGELGQHTDLVLVVARSDRVLAEVATLWIALAVAMFGNQSAGPAVLAATLTAAAAALLPSALLGHSAHHNSSLLAPVALGVHIVAAAVWVGGLLALVVHLRPFAAQFPLALRRFSAAALVCVVLIGSTGLLEAVLMLDSWSQLWETDRGLIMLAKTACLVVLAGVGYLHRRRTMPAAAGGRLGPLLRLAAGELVVMGATMGLAVALSTTA